MGYYSGIIEGNTAMAKAITTTLPDDLVRFAEAQGARNDVTEVPA